MTTQETAFIKVLSANFIKENVPEEAGVFDEIADDFLSDPTTYQQTEVKDSALGFGLAEVISIATPAIISMISVVVAKLGEPVVKGIVEATTGTLTETTIKIFGKYFEIETSDDKETLKNKMIEEAGKYGIPKYKREFFAQQMILQFSSK